MAREGYGVTIELDEKVIKNIMAKSLKSLEKTLKQKINRILQRLAKEVALPAAQGTYGTAVRVTTERTSKGYKIVAEGEAVGFLEFGAGTMSSPNHPFASDAPFAVYPGSWSQTHNREFSENRYWVFGGKRYEYVEPRPGLYEAYKQILLNVERICIEELGISTAIVPR